MGEIKIAYYKKEDWKRLLRIVDDSSSMHDSWDEWHQAFNKAKKELISKGFHVIDVQVDLDELVKYCRIRGVMNTGKSRSQFVQGK